MATIRPMDGKQKVKEFFSQHAAAYTVRTGYGVGKDLQLFLSLMAPKGSELVLDVATAAGGTAVAMAPLVSRVVGVDLTLEMHREFEQQARESGVNNLHFVLGDVERLPFGQDVFDQVALIETAPPEVAAEVLRRVPSGLAFLKRRMVLVAAKP